MHAHVHHASSPRNFKKWQFLCPLFDPSPHISHITAPTTAPAITVPPYGVAIKKELTKTHNARRCSTLKTNVCRLDHRHGQQGDLVWCPAPPAPTHVSPLGTSSSGGAGVKRVPGPLPGVPGATVGHHHRCCRSRRSCRGGGFGRRHRKVGTVNGVEDVASL
jgi:hypothetical protein